MDGLSLSLLLAAGSVGVVHTLLGPDHYLPFAVLARAQGWSWLRTLTTAALCGLAHVAAALGLGVLGLSAGAALGEMEGWEAARGDWAAWGLVAFGLAYAAWGLRWAWRSSVEFEPHAHGDHVHIHRHGGRPHAHGVGLVQRATTFWVLLLVFVLGPCEPLLPLFVLPASRGRWELAAATAAVFALVTVVTIVVATAAGLASLKRIRLESFERWGHSLSGAAVAASGGAILALGL